MPQEQLGHEGGPRISASTPDLMTERPTPISLRYGQINNDRNAFLGNPSFGEIKYRRSSYLPDEYNKYKPVWVLSVRINQQIISFYSGDPNVELPTRDSLIKRQNMLRNLFKDVNTQEELNPLLQAMSNFVEDESIDSPRHYSRFVDQNNSWPLAIQDYKKDLTAEGGMQHHIVIPQGKIFANISELTTYIRERQQSTEKFLDDVEKYKEEHFTPGGARRIGGGVSRVLDTNRSVRTDVLASNHINSGSLLESFRESTPTGREDYVGEPEVLERMDEIIESLKHADLYRKAALPVERKLLLAGPPGTGKTLFAQTIAHELGAKFYKPTFSQTGSAYQAAAGLRMNAILDEVEKMAGKGPTVLLIDELDGMGNSGDVNHISDSTQGMRDALLTRIEQMSNPNLIIIGTTNKSDSIDPALQRHGRFGKPIKILPFVNNPVKVKAMEIFMRQNAKEFDRIVNTLFSSKIDFSLVLQKLPASVTGAELSHLIKLALAKRGRRVREKIRTQQQYNDDLVTTEDVIASISEAFPESGSNRGTMGYL